MSGPVRIDLKDASTFPSRRVEDWKYTDLRRFLRETPPSSAEIEVAPGGPFAAIEAAETVVANGRLLGDAATGPVRCLRFVSRGEGTGHQSAINIDVPAGESVLVLESHEGDGGYVANVAMTVTVGEGGRFERVVIAGEGDTAISLVRADVHLARGAAFAQTILLSGAKIQRYETYVSHPGEGAEVRMDGLYVLAGARHADMTSEVDHAGPDGVTTELTKGVVRDNGRGVFQGRIVVREGADGTDARMGHHALILSDRGEVDAKPELEIYADDVACAHGNTIGSLDESALFYAGSRGIPEAEARAMLIEAYLAEVIDRIAREDVRDVCRAWLAEQLS